MIAAATSLNVHSSAIAGMHVMRMLVALTVLPIAIACLIRRRGDDRGGALD